ncbi:BRO family protein [Vibrio sp. FNV 38]|nr:BRO family protein [Vibrio sp. FNV 38]
MNNVNLATTQNNTPTATDSHLFSNTLFGELTVLTLDGEPWFIGKEVATMLGYSDTSKAIRMHCKKVDSWADNSSGQVRATKIIPESDLYRLVMRSKLPAAEKFEDWVVEGVIPSIRKSGSFGLPQSYPDALEALASQARANEQLQFQLVQSQNEKRALELSNTELYFDGAKSVTALIQGIPNYIEFIHGACDATATQVAEELKAMFYGERRCSAVGVNKALEHIGFINRSNLGSICICRQVVKVNIGKPEHDNYPVWNVNALKSCQPFMDALEDYINKEL